MPVVIALDREAIIQTAEVSQENRGLRGSVTFASLSTTARARPPKTKGSREEAVILPASEVSCGQVTALNAGVSTCRAEGRAVPRDIGSLGRVSVQRSSKRSSPRLVAGHPGWHPPDRHV
jgi:hypothetical protein